MLKGNISIGHILQQDPQRPDGRRPAMVAMAADPLWRTVHSGPIKVRVDGVLDPKSMSLNSQRLRRIMVFWSLMSRCLQELPEGAAGQFLLQGPTFRDQVEEVLRQLGPLQDQDETVGPLEPVQEPNDAG